MDAATGPDRSRRRRSWRRRPSAWEPSISNGDRFEMDRRSVEGDTADLLAPWDARGRVRTTLQFAGQAAGAIGLLVLGFAVLPFWTAFAGAAVGAMAVAWWIRAFRHQRPWHRRRLRSRPHDPSAPGTGVPR